MEVNYEYFQFLKSLIKQNGMLPIGMLGASMEPLYSKTGESIDVYSVHTIQELQRFDLIVFWKNDILTFHYLWSINEIFNDSVDNPTIQTRPLNPIYSYDNPVTFNNILGKVRGKKISLWMKVRIYFSTWIAWRMRD